ncbi:MULTISPECIES: hypothetical protein [Nostoc]|uniref:Uncharacterized protein n=1 Tax=Nostoc punctiforme FACHB-252 TaxID=1357509 RepID=A0ABR8HIB8_NOSPU|nr:MULTISPECIES: hypothetical protein [Nostoc]MBC1240161.1 hypothetical protein [Nostoc sp. 2RC]MBD2615021.1 hypothetical protein [Nostoc punctiforme FACHB-252]MBL1200590.1 hypothetical protein [Nostoc sp. GBBB01]MDZ8013361.1 hypothetical protein [Nostoc sp. ZfuVER08]
MLIIDFTLYLLQKSPTNLEQQVLSSWETTKITETVVNRENPCSNFSLPSLLSLLQLCYVGEENPAHQPEGLAAPSGVENHPYALDRISTSTPFSPQ